MQPTTKSNDPFLKKKFIITSIIVLILTPLCLLLGVTLWQDRRYNILSLIMVILACIPFFLSFEHKKPKPREILIIAVMSAIAVAGRAAFVWAPAFKPVTAIVVITGFSFGPAAGFLTGAATAITSNIFFGQGPWTPFQMFAWGILGYIAGVLGKTDWMKYKIWLIIFGLLSGILYSFIMDIWTVISYDGKFTWSRYFAAAGTAIPYTATYAISNIIFLLLLAKPIGEKLKRIKIKYGLLEE
ncbi:ECF transporter S component [Rummeliibacillus sp. SL167]|uniref:ECF transporter S component n=1 Tax=Rummeliibacillus sp. SL167 TaxID=2579792 RepID=UPI002107CCEB|nr:ECF transporter S component [Rummeliibacillus sp. SL167]